MIWVKRAMLDDEHDTETSMATPDDVPYTVIAVTTLERLLAEAGYQPVFGQPEKTSRRSDL